MTNQEFPDPELMSFAQQAQTLLEQQAGHLDGQQLHENRLLGIKVFDGRHSEGWQSVNRLQVYDGSVRNRLTQEVVSEHKLILNGLYSAGLSNYFGPSNAVTFSARANLLTGEAKYSSESTIMWLNPAKVDRDSSAWRFIIPHLTNLNNFFRGKYDGPNRLS
jgi:hypothetical protein